MSGFTPGPWFFGRTAEGERLVLGDRMKYVARIRIHQVPRVMGLHEEKRREANAQLIVAAPDLYDALDGLRVELAHIAMARACAVGRDKSEWDSFLTPSERLKWAAALDALAKARGEATP